MKNGGWTSRVSSSFQGIVEITNLETRTKHVTISNVTNIFFFSGTVFDINETTENVWCDPPNVPSVCH